MHLSLHWDVRGLAVHSHITLFQQQTPLADEGWLNLLAVQHTIIRVSKYQNAFQWKAKQLRHLQPSCLPQELFMLSAALEYITMLLSPVQDV